MTRTIGLVLLTPLAGFAIEAALGAGGLRPHAVAWAHTLGIAGAAAAAALALGVPAGIVLSRSRSPALLSLTLVPLLLPPALWAAAWMGLRLPAPGALACGAILGAGLWPLVALLLQAALRRIPADALDAASVHLPASRGIRRVVWPHVRPSLIASTLLVAVLAASEFSVPATFAVPCVSMTIYEEVYQFRFGSALAAALPLAALILAAAILLRRVPFPDGSGEAREWIGRGALRGCGALAALAWLLTGLAPLALFAGRVGALPKTLAVHGESLFWSGLFAGSAALLLMAWSVLARGRSRLEPLWLASLVLPGVVIAFGADAIAGRLGVQGALKPSGLLLVLTLMARYAFAAWMPLRGAVDPAQLEAAELAGLPRARIWRKIVWPALRPRAAAAGLAVFVLALGELGPSVLLAPPGRMMAVHHLFTWMHYGYSDEVASLSLALFGAAALVTWGALHAGRRLAIAR